MSKLGKFYHSTTSKYNGYFNANVIYEETLLSMRASHVDNYTQVIPLFPERDIPNPKEAAGELDRAIEKLSTVISIHRPGEWTDDSYLLMGKVQVLKQDFEAAEETLEFFEDEFDPVSVKKKNDKVKSKKATREKQKERKEKVKTKEQERKEQMKERKKRIKARKKGKRVPPPKASVKQEEEEKKSEAAETVVKPTSQPEEMPSAKSGFFVHENVYPEGLLWLARTYIERDKYSLAKSTMNKLALFPMTAEVQRQVSVVEAYYFLHQKQYRAALPKLLKSLEMAKGREDRSRYAFIIAQIYQMERGYSDAIAYYSECLSSGPDYEMEFHARLNRLVLERVSGKVSGKEYENVLSKMLKDDKNIEYSGYIHLALANAAEQNGDLTAALSHLKDALGSEEIDAIQRAEAYLRIADIYFSLEDYADAKDYYDSTSTLLLQNDPRLARVNQQVALLDDIAKNIRIIELQDSLLAISRMGAEEKKALVASMKEKDLAKAKAQENEKTNASAALPVNKRFPGANSQALSLGGTGTLTSNFFAYDPRLVKKGKREFEKRWGDRTLEDDWRRSNKRTVNFFEQAAGEEAEEQDLSSEVTVADINRYLSAVPSNAKEMAEAEKKIMDAYFELGRLYRDKMLNNTKSVETLETLIERYPESPHTFDAWFLLYLAHKDLGNTAEAKKYADLIVAKNRDSKYAQVILDPDYASRMLSQEEKLIIYYDETYSLFEKGKYQEAFDRIENSASLYGQDNPLVPRFALLKAMCLGNLESKESYVEALKEVVAKFPDSPEAVRAREIMRFLQGDQEAFESLSEDVLETTDFTTDDASLHYVIAVLFDLGENTLDQVKIAAANYNRDNYRNQKFRVAHNMLSIDPQVSLILIRKFDSKSQAMSYATKIENDPNAFMPKGVNFEVYAITQQNYREVLSKRSVNEYRLFYAKNYRDN